MTPRRGKPFPYRSTGPGVQDERMAGLYVAADLSALGAAAGELGASARTAAGRDRPQLPSTGHADCAAGLAEFSSALAAHAARLAEHAAQGAGALTGYLVSFQRAGG
jgi:hypothetical protein